MHVSMGNNVALVTINVIVKLFNFFPRYLKTSNSNVSMEVIIIRFDRLTYPNFCFIGSVLTLIIYSWEIMWIVDTILSKQSR